MSRPMTKLPEYLARIEANDAQQRRNRPSRFYGARTLRVCHHYQPDITPGMMARGVNAPAARRGELPAGAPLVAGLVPARATVRLRPPDGMDHLTIGAVCRDMQRAAAGLADHDLQLV